MFASIRAQPATSCWLCTELVSTKSKLATCLANRWLSAVQLWGGQCRVLIRGSSLHRRFCRVPCITFRQIVLLFWGMGFCFEAEEKNFHSIPPLFALFFTLPSPCPHWGHSIHDNDGPSAENDGTQTQMIFLSGGRNAVNERLLSVGWFRTCEHNMFRLGFFTASRLVPSAHFEMHVCYSLRVEHYRHRTVHPHILCRASVLG